MDVLICSISEFADLCGRELLTAARQERMARYRQHEDQARCLAAGLLLRYALKDKAAALSFNAHGKPFIPGSDIHFNLSHSGDLVVLAVDKDELGVDVEQIKKYPYSVAKRCYTDDEMSWLEAQDDAVSAFYTLWTGKESIMKATGLGFSLSPESFSIMPIENGLHTVKGSPWFLNWYAADGYALCVSSKSDERVQPIYLGRKQLLL